MSVETRPEISSFFNNWISQPKEQVIEEIASYIIETKTNIPDSYYYTSDTDGGLFHPEAQKKVKNIIREDTLIGRLERRAFDAIESWFRQNESGVIAWISPPYPEVYPLSKVIISEIERVGDKKKLYNRSILFDFDEEECLKFAQNLALFSKNNPMFQNPDEVRAIPLILNAQDKGWLYILGELIDDPVLWKGIREGKDREARHEAVLQSQIVYEGLFGPFGDLTEGKKKLVEVLGKGAGSCPLVFAKTAFQLFSDNSALLGVSSSLESDQYGLLEFSCPKCKRVNKRWYGQLLENCQHCRSSIGC